MNSDTPVQISLQDPLNKVTRQERKMLLITSTIGVLIVKAGLIPSKISALGIELDSANQHAFQVILAFVVIYFLVAFVLYGVSDFLSWRIAYNEASKLTYQNFFDDFTRGSLASDKKYYPKEWVPMWPRKLAFYVSVLRAFFEFFLPVVFSVYAIFLLFTRL